MKTETIKRYGLLAAFTLLISSVFLIWSAAVNEPGFPLDDAWIHQTFARNLAADGQWAFTPGQPSAGSTSPLWSALLAAGYALRINPLVWTMALGILCLFITGVICDQMWRRLQPDKSRLFLPLFGLLIVSEWHLVWAALSGMETILYVLLICAIFALLVRAEPPWLIMGLLAGVLLWVRPDGLTMLGPILLLAFWNRRPLKNRLISAGWTLLPVAVSVLGYMAFNHSLDGSIWPNTLYAKQTEYAILREQPFWKRYFDLFLQLNIGAGLVLLPGVFWQVHRYIKKRDIWGIGAALWVLGFVGVYALQLPVTYQHARYLIPAIPLYLLIGFCGISGILKILTGYKRVGYVLRYSWLFIIMAVHLAFAVLGGQAYAKDVAIIQTEMVKTALWIHENLPSDTVIAAHDIGALGYFTSNPIVDLAGLIEPEVIPIIRDEEALLAYIHYKNVRYLVSFPEWYPFLVQHAEIIYNTGSFFSPEAGGENISVYLVQQEN
jgi:hypothetical protein